MRSSELQEVKLLTSSLDQWGLTDSSYTKVLSSSGQAPQICCGSGNRRQFHFKCSSEENLSLETAVVLKGVKLHNNGCYDWRLGLDVRCWRCRLLVIQLNTLRGKGILLGEDSEVTECAEEGCSNGLWVGTIYCHDHLVSALVAARKTPQSFMKQLNRIRDLHKGTSLQETPRPVFADWLPD